MPAVSNKTEEENKEVEKHHKKTINDIKFNTSFSITQLKQELAESLSELNN